MFEWNIFYNLVNFGILGFGVYKFGKGMAKNTVKGYQDKVSGEVERAKQAEVNAAKLRESMGAVTAEGKSDCDRMIAEANAEAAALAKESEREEEHLRAVAEADNASSYEQMCFDMQRRFNSEAAQELTDAAADMLRQSSPESKKRLIARFIGELPEKLVVNQSDRVKLASGEKLKVTVTGSAELTDEDVAKITHILQNKFGADAVDVTVARDDALIAGVCVAVGDSLYNGSLRAQLDRVRKSVA